MGQRENQKWARYAEWTARLAYALTRDRSWWHDAKTTDGTPVEVKACRRRKGHRERPGTWWIEREAHRELREHGGVYVFVVYDPVNWKYGPVLGIRMVPAVWLDFTGYSWVSTNGHHKGSHVRKPPWTALFRPDEISGEVTTHEKSDDVHKRV